MAFQSPVHRHNGFRTDEQRRSAADKRRGTTAQRGYDKVWQRVSIEFRAQHPFCECDEHMGRDERALSQVVDHRIPISDRPDLRLEWSNLRAMTKSCHDRHTAKTQGFSRRGDSDARTNR